MFMSFNQVRGDKLNQQHIQSSTQYNIKEYTFVKALFFVRVTV